MKNKLFTILLLLSLLLFSSCELIAQNIVGEKAAGAEKLLEGSCVTIKDQDDNIIKTIPLTVRNHYMVLESYVGIHNSEFSINNYKIDLYIEMQNGFLRNKKGYVNYFYIDDLSFCYENDPDKVYGERINCLREDGKSTLLLEYLNEGEPELTSIFGRLYLKDSRKDGYELYTYLTIDIFKKKDNE